MKPIGRKNNNEELDKVLEHHVSDSSIHTNRDEKKSIESLKNKLKSHMQNDGIHITRAKQDEWDSKETVAGSRAKADRVMAMLEAHKALDIHVSRDEKTKMMDKYTKNELDNKIIACTSFINWKPPVDTKEEFETKYASKYTEEGDFVYVNEEARGYRYTNGKWYPITISIYPYATTENGGGLISENDYKKLANIEDNANNYTHPDNSETRHVSDSQIREWNNKAASKLADYYTAGLMSPEDKMVIDHFKNNHIVPGVNDNIPIVKDPSNLVTIGPKYSPANFICEENTSLSDIIEKIMNTQPNVKKIKLLYSPYQYFTDKPIIIQKSNLDITAEPGITVYNMIPLDSENKFIFTIDGVNNSISNIILSCEKIERDKAKYGCLKIKGSNNTVDKIVTYYGEGIIINGSSHNTVRDCTCTSNQNGIEFLSDKNTNTAYNRAEHNNITNCVAGIVVSTFKGINTSNVIANNIITNCGIGIHVYNKSKTYNNTPEYNIISHNIISRGIGRPTDYGTGQYTILIKGSDNILAGNITRGKGIDVDSTRNTVSDNII